MAQHGIPPSPDRLEFQRYTILSALAVLIVAGGLFYLFIGREARPNPFPERSGGVDPYSETAYAEELLRADAYRALREYIDKEARSPGVQGVYCRDSSHRTRGDYIEFRGDVDLERRRGRMDRHSYSATLKGATGKGWEIVSFTLKDAPEPVVSSGQNRPVPRQEVPVPP